VRIFLSTVSDEFRDYRDQLRHDLTRHNVEVKVQEDFKDLGMVTLDKLDEYITNCDAVVHLVGEMTGAAAESESTTSLLAKYPDLPDRLPPLRQPLADGRAVSYTQWEAWLALYHRKPLVIAKADDAAPRGPKYAPTEDSRAAQQEHLARFSAIERYPGGTFTGPDNLAKQIAYTVILDLLAKDRGNNHLAALTESLVDLATMVFVDLMRLACVSASEAARIANDSRYPEFVDVADLHLAEFSMHVTRINAQIGSDTVQKCLLVERHAAYVLVRLRRTPNLDRPWREIASVLEGLAEEIHRFAEHLRLDYYAKQVEEVSAIAGPAIRKTANIPSLKVPNEFVRVRFLIQSIVLRHMNESKRLTISTIRDDIDRRLAVPYFAIDVILLRAISPSERPLQPLGLWVRPSKC
jgi:hypothetical protein